MPRKSIPESINQAALGNQELLTLSTASITLTAAQQATPLINQGAITAAGDYFCDIPVRGLSDLEIHVRASAASGTITPTAYSTYADGTTSKTAGTDSGAGALAANTRRTFTFTGLKGVQLVRLKLVIAAASSVTFDQAEANGL